jgi:DNA-binding IclR family transcriptional regulator
MRVLEAFAGRADGIALTELCASLGHGKGSLSKILGTLEREGFVRQDPLSGHFHLSWRLLALAFGHAQRIGIPALCLPILQSLADDTDELVQLAVVDHEQILFVAKAEGRSPRIRTLPLVGLTAPAHATASGKVWLASLSDAGVARVLGRQGLPRVAPRTLTSRAKLTAELRRVRERGYAIVDEELVEAGGAVAAAIAREGHVVGAVAVSGPTFRLPAPKLERLAPRVQRAAGELAAIWPLHVTPRDFGLGVSGAVNGGVRARKSS